MQLQEWTWIRQASHKLTLAALFTAYSCIVWKKTESQTGHLYFWQLASLTEDQDRKYIAAGNLHQGTTVALYHPCQKYGSRTSPVVLHPSNQPQAQWASVPPLHRIPCGLLSLLSQLM